MVDRKIEYGLIQTFSPHMDNIDCCDSKCGRSIQFMEKCFIDSETGDIYCYQCGVCVRYERKKASERQAMGLPDIQINGE